MSHIRFFNHYFNRIFLIQGIIEGVILIIAFYSAWIWRAFVFGAKEIPPTIYSSLFFSLVIILCMVAMGVYGSKAREGLAGMMLRTVASIFFIGFIMLSLTYYLIPSIGDAYSEKNLAITSVFALLLLGVFRWVYFHFLGEEKLRRKIIVIGTGIQACKLLDEVKTCSECSFYFKAFIRIGGTVEVQEKNIIDMPDSLSGYVMDNAVDEIVVAVDDRRRYQNINKDYPLSELLECKLRGVKISDAVSFIERETGKIEPRNLSPGWMIFCQGFNQSKRSDFYQRMFDVFASLALLFFAWPIMLLTVIAIKLEEGLRAPVIYNQIRVGQYGKIFHVHKFRSMRIDAEKNGARWAQENDPRITYVGRIIRNVRIDELPQIFNVLKGEMSFVGPRPERPEFVERLSVSIPYFDERHRVKPGITGWAQLCYPYGASDQDSEEKLKYDLYYVKNRSVFLDFIILVQTIEVILIGKGVR